MKRILIFLMALAMVFGLSVSAYATLITFSDQAAFLASTGATSATGSLPNLGLIPSGSQVVGAVTFSIAPPSSALFIGASGRPDVIGGDWTSINPGNDIAISDVENLNVDLASPVYALGFDFVEPTDFTCYAGCYDSTFAVTLKNGIAEVGSFTFNAPDSTLAFVGVWTDTLFNRVEIRDTTSTIDDEFFGEFYTGTTPVPEPATLLLLGSGLAGLAVLRKRFMGKGNLP